MTDSPIPGSKRSIMMVDDNPEVVEVARITLEGKGFNVKCAYSGKDLFAGLEEQKPDLILLDIMMPQMDGFEVLTRLKCNPATASIPVILQTVKGEPEDVLEGYKKGAAYYLTKPFTKDQLLKGVNLVLGGDQGQLAGSP